MLLSKIWHKSKGPLISLSTTTAVLIGGLWSFDFQKLSPTTTLTSQTIYDLRVGLTTLFLLILFSLLSCVFAYAVIAVIKNKKSLEKELKNISNSIRKTVKNNYTIHQRETLSPSIRKAMNKEGSKGFNLPQGSLAGRLFDIHLNEVSVYSSIIREVSSSFASNNGIDFSEPEFIYLFSSLLTSHNVEIKNYHNSLITDLFDRDSSTHAVTMVDHFNKQSEIETILRLQELLSTLKVKNLSACEEVVFPPWIPAKKEKPKQHTYTPDNDT